MAWPKGKPRTAEMNAKTSAACLRKWDDPELRQLHRRSLAAWRERRLKAARSPVSAIQPPQQSTARLEA